MLESTRQLWDQQDRHPGDRKRLFSAVANWVDADTVLYPGSFCDVAPSFAFPDVTYVDNDGQAAEFFADAAGVDELIAEHRVDDGPRTAMFIKGDFTSALDIEDESVDLLMSLSAGFVSEHCTRYLRIGGSLLVNPSHGDVALVALDERYEHRAVVKSAAGDYQVDSSNLEAYMIPKRAEPLSTDEVRSLGRGITYTRSPFAYLFERMS